MKSKRHPFFQKNKSFKYFLLVHLAISLIVFISQLIHGSIQGDAFKSIARPFKNYIALNNPKKYLKSDFFIVDSAFVEQNKSSAGASTSHSDYTVIKGYLAQTKIQREITIQGNNLSTFYDIKYVLVHNKRTIVYVKKDNPIKVLKSKLNNEIFFDNPNVIQDEKCNAIIGLYFQFSLISLIIILLTLKKNSEIN